MNTPFTKIIGIDALRGLAAVLVFVFHYWTFYKNSLPSWTSIFSIGHVGVDLFFVLSGFLVTLSLWRSSSFTSYFTKRIRRIAPLAIITTLVFWGMKTDFSLPSFHDLFAHLFFINGFFPQWYHSINPVAWSISVEMAFYLLLPAVWILLAKKNLYRFLYIFAGLVILSFCYRAGLFFIFEDWSSTEKIIFSEQLWGRLDQFFLGILLAAIVQTKKINIKTLQPYTLPLSAFFLGIACSTFYMLQSSFRDILFGQVFLHFITAGGFFFLILWIMGQSEQWEKRKEIRIFSFFGDISYGIYLLHFPILSIIAKTISNPLLGFCISYGITCIASWISWTWFERWFLTRSSIK